MSKEGMLVNYPKESGKLVSLLLPKSNGVDKFFNFTKEVGRILSLFAKRFKLFKDFSFPKD
jgi:hypothetical protein